MAWRVIAGRPPGLRGPSALSVSSFWAHPAALAAFPAAGLSPVVLRFETRPGRAACAAMAVFLAGACAWVAVPLGAWGAGRAPGPFHRGRSTPPGSWS